MCIIFIERQTGEGNCLLSASIYVGFRNEDGVFVCTIDTIVASMFEENQRFISDFRFTSLHLSIII